MRHACGRRALRGLGGALLAAALGACFGTAPTIRGTDADDRLCGGPGRDQIDGGPGRDRPYGRRGDDTLTGDNPPVDRDVRDVCLGGLGRNRLIFC